MQYVSIDLEEYKSKIFHLESKEAQELIKKLKKTPVITTNGCFDIIHAGHIHYLKVAEKFDAVFIVGLNSDISTKKLKGESRPIIDEDNRALALAMLPFVDYVFLYDSPYSPDFVRQVKPDFHINSAVYGEDCIERPVLDEYGGELIMVEPFPQSVSVTQIISKIKQIV